MIIKNAVILANSKKENIQEALSKMKAFLNSNGIETKEIFLTASNDDANIKITNADIAISLGGDGTVLSCSALLKGTGIPLLAVKFGTFGYITETSTEEFETVFEDLLAGRNFEENRMMIRASVKRNGKEVFCYDALNEITVSPVEPAKLLKLNLYINDILAANLKSDGILFSTPTGSTAYNLSAGGPILDAELSSIIVNPICPFALSVRPLVVNGDTNIKIKVPKQELKAVLFFDGHESFPLLENDEIEVTKSIYFTKFIRNNKRNRIEILRDKLGWAGGLND